MSDKVGDVYEGVVTGVTSYGLYVELVEYFVEGLAHISTLVDDYYHYNEEAHTLRGESTGRIFRLADRVTVLVAKVDLVQRRIELAIEGLEPPRSRAPKGRTKAAVGTRRRRHKRQ
jgi:ribonuclease R